MTFNGIGRSVLLQKCAMSAWSVECPVCVEDTDIALDGLQYGDYSTNYHAYLGVSHDGCYVFTRSVKDDGSDDGYLRYELAVPYDFSTAWPSTQQVNTSMEDPMPNSGIDRLHFSLDGMVAYANASAQTKMYQYQLPSPYDLGSVSTATNFDFSPETGTGSRNQHVAFSSDGAILYLAVSASTRIFQYDLATAWDITTTTYSGKMKEFTDGSTFSYYTIAVSPDGEFLFSLGRMEDNTKLFSIFKLTTPHDISTAVFFKYGDTVKNYECGQGSTLMSEYRFNIDGTKLAVGGAENGTNDAKVWTMDTITINTCHHEPFDITCAECQGTSVDLAASDTDIHTIFSAHIINYGRNVLVVVSYGSSGGDGKYFMYDLSTQYDLSTMVLNSSMDAVDGYGDYIRMTEDGTTLLATGGSTDIIKEYDISTPYDLSTASLTTTKTLSQNSSMQSMWWHPDGTKLYIVGSSNEKVVYVYSVTTPYHLAGASLVSQSSDLRSPPYNKDILEPSVSADGTIVLSRGSRRILSTPFDFDTQTISDSKHDVCFDSQTEYYDVDGVAILARSDTSLQLALMSDKIIVD